MAAIPEGRFNKNSRISTTTEAIIAKLAGKDFSFEKGRRIAEARALRGGSTPAEVALDTQRVADHFNEKVERVFKRGDVEGVSTETHRHLKKLTSKEITNFWENLLDTYQRTIDDKSGFAVANTLIYQNRQRWNDNDVLAAIHQMAKLLDVLERKKRNDPAHFEDLSKAFCLEEISAMSPVRAGRKDELILAGCVMSAEYDPVTRSNTVDLSVLDRVLKTFEKHRSNQKGKTKPKS
jgi:hypothetical protein